MCLWLINASRISRWCGSSSTCVSIIVCPRFGWRSPKNLGTDAAPTSVASSESEFTGPKFKALGESFVEIMKNVGSKRQQTSRICTPPIEYSQALHRPLNYIARRSSNTRPVVTPGAKELFRPRDSLPLDLPEARISELTDTMRGRPWADSGGDTKPSKLHQTWSIFLLHSLLNLEIPAIRKAIFNLCLFRPTC